MDLLEFLTSKEIIVVYIVAGVACLLCFIIYLVEKNNVKAQQRHNTKELNKLVEQIKEKEDIEEEKHEEPVLQVIETDPVEVVNEVVPEVIRDEIIVDSKMEIPTEEETLEYTSIEPDQETAKLELQKLSEELKKQEEIVEENISLTSYEEAQEENAIISLEELVKKSKDMYEANELTQYADEGNEPISLQEFAEQVGKQTSEITDTFIIENVVPKEELEKVEEEPTIIRQVSLDDFETVKVDVVEEVKEEKEEVKKFKNSPIISPIFGIEKSEVNDNELALENTADYEKLDQEIKKTNEFLMTLKELQSKLD